MGIQLPLRITVVQPLPGVTMQLQRGRDGLLPPTESKATEMSFDFEVRVEPGPNFLGEFTQGPKQVRFVYVNSGTSAGQLGSEWTRRAKVTLMTITPEQIAAVLSQSGRRLEARIPGVARNGGPICASVPNVMWSIRSES